MLKDPVEFALDQALLSIKRMEQRLPAITFNRDALYQAFDAARAFNLSQRKKCNTLAASLEALESCDAGDWSTGHVIHPSYNEELVAQAIKGIEDAK